MFNGAVVKLRDARTAIVRLHDLVSPSVVSNVQIMSGASGPKSNSVGTRDPVAFAESFSTCVAQVRSIGDAILKNKAAMELNGFKSWRELKKKECMNDDLLLFLNDRRNNDLHEGASSLAFVMHPFSFSSESVGAAPSPAATLLIDGTGPHWLVDQGTPRERRLPCEQIQGVKFTVAVVTPPPKHLGSVLQNPDPVTLINLAEAYYANLLYEARNKFESK